MFPTWHRAYLLLFEQRVYELMLRVIERYPSSRQPQLRQAADTWRLPFWDTASARVPDICINVEIDVDGPGGRQRVLNPMHEYHLTQNQTFASGRVNTPNEPSRSVRYDQTRATSRCPRGQENWIDGVQNVDLINSYLSLNDKDGNPNTRDTTMKEDVYRLLTYPAAVSYHIFATTQVISAIPRPAGYLSLESVHNVVHVWTGGDGQFGNPGHMASPSVAAFDPIFWMHHNNVDRLLALWQELNPTAWFDNNPRIRERGTDGLEPFNKDSNYTLITSNDVRYCTRLGYTYPELQPWLPEYQRSGRFNQQLYLDAIRSKINGLYGPLRQRVLGLDQTRPLQPPIQRALAAAASTITPVPIAVGADLSALASEPAVAETVARAVSASDPTLQGENVTSAESAAQAMPIAVASIATAERGITQAPISARSTATTAAPAMPASVPRSAPPLTATENAGGVPEDPEARGTEEHDHSFIEMPDYIVNVRYSRLELDRGAQYIVKIYIGESGSTAVVPAYVGCVVTFSSPLPEDEEEPHCENCRRQLTEGSLATGQVPITEAILDHIEDSGTPLDAIDPKAVDEYLTDRLTWKVIRITGEEVPLESLPSLKVSLAVGTVKYYADGCSLPEYTDYQNATQVTQGKQCGLTHDDTF
ncbi:Di-copper centre-containing protein [Eremomyces bilateralis CBS 781.70]|uniref:tyrosinase n=1 Tax=Eremomyces bilateralis CBS 781.70 TaxID=1392243 RepID=A0A6G1G927_9PEZI|nr:Di-copper centre-containing protein [Eremomyces bilateralis CBS 781.70]KAF1814577.1 Di-copper centre-containing protein [Eremomyces bilateralis CBS 781.70]